MSVEPAVDQGLRRVLSSGRWTPSGVDLTVASTIEFRSGAITDHAMSGDGPLPLRIRQDTAATAPFETLERSVGAGFRAEAESFARAVRLCPSEWNGASDAVPIDTALSLEASRRSMREDGWIELEQSQ